MIGSMFAGHTECPGEMIEDENGDKYKLFYGMSSDTAMKNTMAEEETSEGKTVRVPYKGNVDITICNILGGVQHLHLYW